MTYSLYQKILLKKLINEALEKEKYKNNKEIKELKEVIEDDIEKIIMEALFL